MSIISSMLGESENSENSETILFSILDENDENTDFSTFAKKNSNVNTTIVDAKGHGRHYFFS